METAIFIGIIIAFIIHCTMVDFMVNIAVMKGYGKEVHAWALCFWFSVFGWIYVFALPDKILQRQNQ